MQSMQVVVADVLKVLKAILAEAIAYHSFTAASPLCLFRSKQLAAVPSGSSWRRARRQDHLL